MLIENENKREKEAYGKEEDKADRELGKVGLAFGKLSAHPLFPRRKI